MTIHEQIARTAYVEQQKAIRKQLGKDMGRFLEEKRELELLENKIRTKMSRTPKYSGLWWHLLGQLDIVNKDQIALRELTGELQGMIADASKDVRGWKTVPV